VLVGSSPALKEKGMVVESIVTLRVRATVSSRTAELDL
jgi:hypothetical protein